jgi:SpoVK/Ycf46/Vps4 family AAA+-type ATPase
LYGPPGTGKTAFGRWIAQRLDRQLQVRRASDILDPYVGGTEQKIAQVFKQAAADKALLLIDEVDSFLQDRGRAHRSWEVTAVNELLTQMERFPGIFIASTNLMRDLDGAALRRFDLKIRLDYLTADQARRMLRLQCLQLGLGTPHADDMEALQQLDNVTPGDFVNVARQHSFRRFASPAELVRSIAAECALKPDAVSRRIGF